MTEYFGFNVDEGYKGEFLDLVAGVDPKYHPAIAWGLAELCGWYSDKAYRELDEWFSIVYGTILMVEEVHSKEMDQLRKSMPKVEKLNYKDLVAKDKE